MKTLAEKRVARHKKAMKFHEKLTLLIARSPGRWTQKALGKLLGVDQSQVGRYAKGETEPSFRQAVILSEIFRVPVRYLIDDRLGEIPREDMEFTLDPAMFPVVRRLLDEPAFHIALKQLSREEIEARLMAAPGTRPALTPPASAPIVVSEIRGKARDGPSSPAQEPKGA